MKSEHAINMLRQIHLLKKSNCYLCGFVIYQCKNAASFNLSINQKKMRIEKPLITKLQGLNFGAHIQRNGLYLAAYFIKTNNKSKADNRAIISLRLLFLPKTLDSAMLYILITYFLWLIVQCCNVKIPSFDFGYSAVNF